MVMMVMIVVEKAKGKELTVLNVMPNTHAHTTQSSKA
jgi:hypothetical protein